MGAVNVGAEDGRVGCPVGLKVGSFEGAVDVGTDDGRVGCLVGEFDVVKVGAAVAVVGFDVAMVGMLEGLLVVVTTVRKFDGLLLEHINGSLVGLDVGTRADGNRVG